MVSGPCKGCDKRYVGCHSVCDVYNDWHDQHVAECKEKKEQLMIAHLASRSTSAKKRQPQNPKAFKRGV